MITVTKEQVLQSVEKLPSSLLKDAWLFLEFLSTKASAIESIPEAIPHDPAGAFPELDISMESIESILESDWRKRQSRLLADS